MQGILSLVACPRIEFEGLPVLSVSALQTLGRAARLGRLLELLRKAGQIVGWTLTYCIMARRGAADHCRSIS